MGAVVYPLMTLAAAAGPYAGAAAVGTGAYLGAKSLAGKGPGSLKFPSLSPQGNVDRRAAEAADRQRRRRAQARGRGSTILTGAQGLLNPANIGIKQLTGQ